MHPGSVQVQVGDTLRMIRVNIEQQDMAGVANFTRELRALVSIYSEKHRDLWAKVLAIPPFAYEKTDEKAFEDEMQRKEILLAILRKENLFGYDTAPIASGDALSQAFEEDVAA